MAIAPPSDIVFDVAMAADPARLRTATAKLERLGGAGRTRVADTFPALPPVKPTGATRPVRAALDVATPTAFDLHRARLHLRDNTATTRTQPSTEVAAVPDKRREVMRQFEAMVMQNFIASMLPQNSETVYGKGTAGEVWKSMLSDQLGKQTAKAGGIGIAERLLTPAVLAARSTRL